MNTRRFITLSLLVAASFLAGCQSLVDNMTPARIEANASDIYTFRAKVNEQVRGIVEGSLRVDIVINGETHAMKRDTAVGKNVWLFEYAVPSGVSKIPYYYVLSYKLKGESGYVDEVSYSTEFTPGNAPYVSTIVNRYVVHLSSSRGPVGALISILGQGFTEFDKIVMGNVEIPTTFVSHNQLSFTVPAVPAGKSYDVMLRTGDGDLPSGRFTVDASTIGVQPTSLIINVGESVPLTFFIDSPAPEGGIAIEITTDIPECVVMPEVVIPAGERSVSVPTQGAAAGTGYLWMQAEGFEQARIPVTVQ